MKIKNHVINRQFLVHYFCIEVKKKNVLRTKLKSTTLQNVPCNGGEIIRAAFWF